MPYLPIAAIAASLTLVAPDYFPSAMRQLWDEYPTWAKLNDQSAGALTISIIDPKGKAIHCEVVSSVGSARLAKEVCSWLRKVRTEPARDASGTPVYGKIYELTKMLLPDTEQGREVAAAKKRPDLELTAVQLPAESGGTKEVKVFVQVSPEGKVAACRGRDAVDADYASAACGVLEREPMALVEDRDDVAVTYVQQLTVLFRQQAAS